MTNAHHEDKRKANEEEVERINYMCQLLGVNKSLYQEVWSQARASFNGETQKVIKT